MRILLLLILGVALVVVGAAFYFRSVSMPPADWHIDPSTATPPTTPNYALRVGSDAPVVVASPADTAAALDAIARAEGALRIAGDLGDGFATYVQRTRLMGYPDAISIRLSAEGDGTRIDIFSRSRFGHSDWGVNRARVARWIAAVAP